MKSADFRRAKIGIRQRDSHPNLPRERGRVREGAANEGIISTEIAPFGGMKESGIGPIW
jgi:hypothetical protein